MTKKAAASSENELPNAAEIAALKAKYGKLSLLKRGEGFAIVRHPKAADIEMLVGKMREQARANPTAKPRPYDAMRAAYQMLKVQETKGFLENADNENFIYDKMEDFVKLPTGEVVEL